ncbi:hypothetical protein SSX86_013247 [Deinandra increscens subsp. villosa]|uniref:Uncharacterized protein n=1 Tax=Deinandra increscens subsp. villosa TaxID=3103831 RepID=A0AAP0D5R7_9ASTR
MKFLVLVLVVLLTLAFTATSDINNTETYNLISLNNLINSTSFLTKSGCESRCGELIVPYPFGIWSDDSAKNCSIGEGFDIYCNKSSKPPKAYITKGAYSHIKLISDSTVRTSNIVASNCSFPDGSWSSHTFSMSLPRAYTFSKVNKFTVVGCNSYAWLKSRTDNRNVSTGCIVFCSSPDEVGGLDECSGNGCCQSSIPQVINYYETLSNDLQNSDNDDISSFAPCTYAFVGEENVYKFKGLKDLNATDVYDTSVSDNIESNVPVVLDWAIGNLRCAKAKETADFACLSNSKCVDSTREAGGYRCGCNEGYQGNPYLSPGCQDIDECSDPTRFPCNGKCLNTIGNYTCTCKRGYFGDGKLKDGCHRKRFKVLPLYIGVSISIGTCFLIATSFVLYKWIEKTKERRQRKGFFKRNGGILLKQQQQADASSVDKTTLFTSRELEKATDNFNENRILGRGGQGTVYKGMLVDGRIVAVKKSKIVDESQLEQFINEVVILSQVNHRNVVKLLGCSLETEVPMLVSEFIPNGTLYDQLHNETQEYPLSLNMRFQIATEVAGALAYLHSATSIPIYHRDIKTTNILLDEKYRAKISDFGTSKFVAQDQTHLTTLVKGTFGYLDPEYFQSSQFTEKSDVYSFGVVLVELLTGERPLSLTRFGENRSLATHFKLAMEEGRVMSIFDARVINEGSRDELLIVANLAMRCLNFSGKYRPTMKEVAAELETIRTTHIPSTVQTDIMPMICGEELSMQTYGESSSTYLNFTDSFSQ